MARAENAAPYLTLDRYRQLANIPPWLFNGVENPDEAISGCDHCWSQWEREALAQALLDAEETLAGELRYYLGPRFLIDYDHKWTDPLVLNWGHVIGGGIEGLTDVSADVSASNFAVDPATITIPQSSFSGGTSEVYVVETSSGIAITPDSIASSGTNYVISISQYKLLEWDDLENQTQATCIEYDATFPATEWLKLADLTIYRRYLDTSEQATITFSQSCVCWCAGEACAGTERDGCVFVLNEGIGKVRVSMATYSATDDTWSCSYEVVCGCCLSDQVTVQYRAGVDSVPGWEQAVMRLAHTYLMMKPCGCASFDFMLNRDRAEPSVWTVQRLNCPFGTAAGAWYAWQWAQRNKHIQAYMLV